jgi:hypothetical protein
MTYEKLMFKSDSCCLQAILFYKIGEFNLAIFYKNASIEFKRRALNCTRT